MDMDCCCHPHAEARGIHLRFGLGGHRRREHRGRHGHHGPMPWFMGLVGGRRRRAEHGDLRYLILDAVRDEARHGYEVIQLIESRTNGAYRPSPGAVYPTLQMLEEIEHVRSREDDRRRVYEITEEGIADLNDHRDEVEEAYERLGDDFDPHDWDELDAIFRRMPRLFRAVGRALHRGRLGSEQAAEIRRIVDDAVERIEKAARGQKLD